MDQSLEGMRAGQPPEKQTSRGTTGKGFPLSLNAINREGGIGSKSCSGMKSEMLASGSICQGEGTNFPYKLFQLGLFVNLFQSKPLFFPLTLKNSAQTASNWN